MSGSLIHGGGENIPGACAARNFTYLARGPWPKYLLQVHIQALTFIKSGYGVDGLVQYCSNPSELAMELLQSSLSHRCNLPRNNPTFHVVGSSCYHPQPDTMYHVKFPVAITTKPNMTVSHGPSSTLRNPHWLLPRNSPIALLLQRTHEGTYGLKSSLTHSALVTQYGDRDLGQHWPR